MRRIDWILAALCLSACAQPPTPSELAALQQAKEAAAQQVALTPALRNGIAASVRRALWSRWNWVTANPIKESSISQLKVGLPYSSRAADALAPYYCVRVAFTGTPVTLFLPAQVYYKVTVMRTELNQYAMKVVWNLENPPIECTADTTYEPFPELRRNPSDRL